jgi:hypothetical protein
MSAPKKLNIQVRPISSANAPSITAREKTVYHCANCKNKYYSFHYFCPQCLGVVTSDSKEQAALRIVSIPSGKQEQVVQLIAQLTGKTANEVMQGLKSLPRILLDQCAPQILEQWRESLEAEKVECEIIGAETNTKQNRKRPPLFTRNVPLPSFMSAGVERAVRITATRIGNPAIRMKWVEAVQIAFSIFEDSYKRDPNLRVLFPDFLYKIEQQLSEAANEFDPRRGNEEDLYSRTQRLIKMMHEMQSEIRIVRNRITQQL